MTDRPDSPEQQTLELPTSSKAAIGGLGAAIMASLGWITTEFIDLEKSVTQSLDRGQRIQARLVRSDDAIDDRLDDLDDRIGNRLLILDQDVR